MCTAIDEMRKESWEEGLAEGEARGIAKGEARGIAKGEARGIAKGEARGIAKGEARGSRKTLLSNIENVMDAFGVTLERAMDALQVDPAQRESLSRELIHRSGAPGTSQ